MASADLETQLVELTRRYGGRWVIFRDRYLDGGREQWVAELREPADGRPVRITARSVGGLAEKLAAAES